MQWDICTVHQLLSQQRECFSKEDQKIQRGTGAEVSYFCSYTEASFLLPRWHMECVLHFLATDSYEVPQQATKAGCSSGSRVRRPQPSCLPSLTPRLADTKAPLGSVGCSLKPFHTSPMLTYVGMPSMFVRKSAKSPVTSGNWRLYVLTEASLIPAGVALQPKTQLSAFSSTTSETSVRRASCIYRKLGKLAAIPPHRLSGSFFSGCDIV